MQAGAGLTGHVNNHVSERRGDACLPDYMAGVETVNGEFFQNHRTVSIISYFGQYFGVNAQATESSKSISGVAPALDLEIARSDLSIRCWIGFHISQQVNTGDAHAQDFRRLY